MTTGPSTPRRVAPPVCSEKRAIATLRPYGNRYISVVALKDRKIVHWRDYLDRLRVLAALEPADAAETGDANGP